MDLFDTADPGLRPLADRLRPQRVEEVAGQAHLLGPGKPLRRALEENRPHSMVLWVRPAVQDHACASVAHYWRARFLALRRTGRGEGDSRGGGPGRAVCARRARTVLFVDEAHPLQQAQQDAFLPHIEDGTLIFIGATTENPSFELNNACSPACASMSSSPGRRRSARRAEACASRPRGGLGSRALSLPAAAEDMLIRAAGRRRGAP
jgi:putative ATPase